jgi:alanine dehydrogenase
MKIGILREGKIPPDKRVVLSPAQCDFIQSKYPQIELVIQPSKVRKFIDHEYSDLGLKLQENLSDCDILCGIKEVRKTDLIPNKTYLFFSHTIKEQPYNRDLLKKILALNIRMVDYESLTNKKGNRVIGFGRYAGIVGCYNAFLAYGKRTSRFYLKPANLCKDRIELEQELKKINLPPIKIVVTGTGRVGRGIIELLNIIGLKKVSKQEFFTNKFNEAVFVQLDTLDYNTRINGEPSDFSHFCKYPMEYRSDFMKYAKVSDLFIAGHFYGSDSPYLFTRSDAKSPDFKIKTIADISCDINGPIASTLRASTISDPLYGYNPQTEAEDVFNKQEVITVMAVDNLPCELPKDASSDFGQEFILHVLPSLIGEDQDDIIHRATICANGKLTDGFQYLSSYVSDSN